MKVLPLKFEILMCIIINEHISSILVVLTSRVQKKEIKKIKLDLYKKI